MVERYFPTDSFIRSSCALLNALYLALQYTLDTGCDEVSLIAPETRTNAKRLKTIGDQRAHLTFPISLV